MHSLNTLIEILRQEYKKHENIQAIIDLISTHTNHGSLVYVPGHGYHRIDLNRYAKGIMSIFFKPPDRKASFLKSVSSSCPYNGTGHGSIVHSNIELCKFNLI